MNIAETTIFKPGQKVFFNLRAIPQIEKDFTINPLIYNSLEVRGIVPIVHDCTCGFEEGLLTGHLPLCNLTRIKKIGCDQLLTVITGNGLVRTHSTNWFTPQQLAHP